MQMQMKKVIHHFILGPDLATIAVGKKAKSASLPPRTHTRTRIQTHSHTPTFLVQSMYIYIYICTLYIPVSADGVEIAAEGVTPYICKYANMQVWGHLVGTIM